MQQGDREDAPPVPLEDGPQCSSSSSGSATVGAAGLG